MSSLLFYEKPVALSKENHKDTRIRSEGHNFKFASKTNSVILAGVEFSEAAREYPVVFAKSGESTVPVALIGLRAEENLLVADDGSWDARYIPAFVRRYPFVLAEGTDAKQRMVCIDEAFPGFSTTEGDPLFSDGQPTAVLKQAMDFLEEYQRQYVRTEAFVKRLVDKDLLQSFNARVDLVDGKQFSLSGLLVVDEKKLLQLSDDDALAFFKSGELAWVYCHLMSLGCMSSLVDRLAKLTGLASEAKSSAQNNSTQSTAEEKVDVASDKPKKSKKSK